MNKQTQIGIGAGVGILVIAIVLFMMNRPSGETTTTTQTQTPAPTGTKKADDGTGTASATPPSKPGAFGTPDIKKLGGLRSDPFLISWKDNTLPPPNVFDSVQPIRVTPASYEEPVEEVVEVREAPTRRFSGFMNGDGVFAVLEGGGTDTEIVAPGSETKDGFKVVSITSEQVFLRKQEGNVIRTQTVLYGDAPPTAATNTGRPAFGGMGQAGANFGGSVGAGRRPGGKGGGAGSE